MTMMDTDNKHAKFEKAEKKEQASKWRRFVFYSLFSTLIADTYASKADVLNHLTVWSWCLHILYFELHLTAFPTLVKLFHGPSFTGAHALFFMYIWTMAINPLMEFDLAPEGRATWLVLARAFFLHFMPVVFHWIDFTQNESQLVEIYKSPAFLPRESYLFQFWACIGGYFAMGLSWEWYNGDAASTYNVTLVDSQTFVLVSKAIGVMSCLISFSFALKPKLCQ